MVTVSGMVRNDDHSGSWQAVVAAPHPALSSAVHGYGGFHESRGGPVVRRELPATEVVLILDLTQNLAVGRSSTPGPSSIGVIAGVGLTPVDTRHPGEHAALEVRLCALDAQSLLGVPGGELSEQLVDLHELWGSAGSELLERVRQVEGWPERFRLLEDVLLARRRAAEELVDADPALVAAHQLVRDREGRVSMPELLELTGWSRRRLAERFRRHVGMTPKALARLARFRHAERLLRAPGHRSIAAVALTCGYYDQAHLNRDFRDLAGSAPTAYLAQLRADGLAASTPVR